MGYAESGCYLERDIRIGDVVYLIEETRNGRATLRAYLSPGRTNRSGEAKLRGWLGETNNVDLHACGAAVVTQVYGEDWTRPGTIVGVRVRFRRIKATDPRIVEWVRS